MSSFRRYVCVAFSLLYSGLTFAQAPVEIETATQRAVVKQINVTGTVTSPRTAVLSTAVAGLVSELTIDEGHRVEKGEALLKLDAELARLAMQRTIAEVRQRETGLNDAKRRLAEAEKVGTERGIAQTQIDSLRAEVMSDEAALVAAQAAVSEQQAIVNRHVLKAPFSGVISQRLTELGEWVNPGNGLLELVATDNLRFDFRVGQDNYSALSPNAPVAITLDAYPLRVMAGRIDTIVPVKNPGARTFLVRVVADTEDSEQLLNVTPGMSVRGRINIDVNRSAVTVSRDAILRYQDGRITVWVVDNSGDTTVVREQVVTVGLAFDDVLEIVDGLSDGDVVVARGNETLQEDQAVTIVNGSR